MARISLLRSSSTHLAVLFACLIAIAIALFVKELRVMGPGSDISALTLYAIVTLLMAIAASLFYLSFYVTKRINTILHTAETIIHTGDLSARIPIDNRWDDLSMLSEIINRMLAKIEESVFTTRIVSDSIAHDLRTPLTRLRNRIEALQHQPCKAQETQAHMQSLITECDAILGTFQALLRISRIETQHKKDRFVSVPLKHVLEDVIELYEPLASEKNITLHANLMELNRIGDRDLLFQCFANIIDNAIKHTPENGHISIDLTHDGRQIHLNIADSGPGIDESLKERVFLRFFRADTTRQTPGNGLGLSLVSAVIKLHGAHISLNDNTPTGLIVHITL